MEVCLLKSKIHRATITDGNLQYEGSLTVASDLMEKCGLIPYERILCSNQANGNRFETYERTSQPPFARLAASIKLSVALERHFLR